MVNTAGAVVGDIYIYIYNRYIYGYKRYSGIHRHRRRRRRLHRRCGYGGEVQRWG